MLYTETNRACEDRSSFNPYQYINSTDELRRCRRGLMPGRGSLLPRGEAPVASGVHCEELPLLLVIRIPYFSSSEVFLEIDCINRFTVFLVKFANFVMVVIGPPNHHQSTNQFNSKSFGDFGSAYVDFFQLLFHNCSGTMCSLQFYSIKSKTRKNTYAIKLKS